MTAGVRWTSLVLALVALALACGNGGTQPDPDPNPQDTIPATGTAIPGMSSVDAVVRGVMKRHAVPGAAVAITQNGRLVYARGFGYADNATKELVAPDALFRIASLSKAVTAAATLKLVEDGLLTLADHPLDVLSDLEPPAGATVDPRWSQITVRMLLTHAGGWDREQSFDPMFRPGIAAAAVGAQAPASAETVIRYMLGQPLDFDPGTRYAYSNFGYAVLGRMIERVTEQAYDAYVRAGILTPAGIERMQLGSTRRADRAPGEVVYHYPGSTASVFPGDGSVPWPYGGFYIEAMDAHGGWIASTVDLLRFIAAVDGLPTPGDILSPESIDAMVTRPPLPEWSGSASYYAMGWSVRPTQGDANWWHTGALAGTNTLMVRAYNGLAWVVLMNTSPIGVTGDLLGDVDGAMWDGVGGVTSWPTHDLFDQFP
jgi:N-acyl-D-amino-acid deacylase